MEEDDLGMRKRNYVVASEIDGWEMEETNRIYSLAKASLPQDKAGKQGVVPEAPQESAHDGVAAIFRMVLPAGR
jgi:hypothetical protein